MKQILNFVLIFLSVLVASCEEIDGPGQGDEPSLAQQIPGMEGIVGGTPTGFKDWTGVIAVRGGGLFGGLCTGTLIHPQVVLTAAHCVKFSDGQMKYDYTKTPGKVTIMKGANALAGTQIAMGAEAVVHPNWVGSYEDLSSDLALIKLNKEITNLPHYSVRDYPLPKDGDPGKLVGYGGTSGSGAGAGTHRQGDTTLLHVLSTTIETGSPANTCQGDSGGPLFSQQNGEWVVTGVTSFGLGECQAKSGNYSTNILAYCDFLNEAMEKLVGEDLGLEGCKKCEAPSYDGEWGQPCGTGYPCCPEGLNCRYPKGFAKAGIGMCTPQCCEAGSVEENRCPAISDGAASCAFVDDSGAKYCGVACDYDKDCPQGSECIRNQVTQSVDDKFCVPQVKGPGDEICEEPIGEGEGEGEGGNEGGGGKGEDSGGEGEGEGETVLTDDDSAGCGCNATGAATLPTLPTLLHFLMALTS